MEQNMEQNNSNNNNNNNNNCDIKKLLIDEMEKGKKSTQIIRDILIQRPRFKIESHDDHDHGDGDYFKALDHHCMVAMTSCVTSLSLMRSFEFNGSEIVDDGKRKMDDHHHHHHHDLDDHDHHHNHGHDDDDIVDGGQIKHEDVSTTTTSTKDRRGCYKRRKRGDGRAEEVTQLRDDGYAWRKYGQKVILNTIHPRNYYRCTHKFDKKCPATKQVQQISENPTKYRIIYHGYHICNYNNHLTQSTIVVDDDSSDGHSSAIVLNFDQKYQINPLLFPTSATTSATAVPVKQEYNSPLSYQSASHDQTAMTGPSSSTTLVSEQSDLISTAENCSSTTTKLYEVEEDYYSCIWSDHWEVLDDVFSYKSHDFGIDL